MSQTSQTRKASPALMDDLTRVLQLKWREELNRHYQKTCIVATPAESVACALAALEGLSEVVLSSVCCLVPEPGRAQCYEDTLVRLAARIRACKSKALQSVAEAWTATEPCQ